MAHGNKYYQRWFKPLRVLIYRNHSDKTLHDKGILDPGVVCFKEINNPKINATCPQATTKQPL